MPRKKWIDKNNPDTQTFQLLYRSQDDPLLNDDAAGDRALFPVGGKRQGSSSVSQKSANKALHLADLEEGQDLDFESMRDNEGEAAEYGIYFDDTKYDYMQHLKDLGSGGGESHFVDAIPTKVRGKKQQVRLEDALRQVNLDDEEEEEEEEEDDEAPSLVSGSQFSRTTKGKEKRLLEAQQDVPDEIAGFQPDMDPRLREVLEALEDDAYVDDKDEEDVFGALGNDGQNNGELDLDEFEIEGQYLEGEGYHDDDGWDSDATEKAPGQARGTEVPKMNGHEHHFDDDAAAAAAAAEDGDWLRDFAKYKRDTAGTQKVANAQANSVVAPSSTQDRAPTLYTLNGTPLRQKKRKGAMTNPSAYSMTSSSLNRGDGLQLLDRRFDQVEKMYTLDEDEFDDMDGGASMVSGMTGASKMSKMSAISTSSFADPNAVRSDFGGMMDDFLGDWNKANPGGKRKGAKGKRGKNGNEVYGLQQLDDVRKELGPARLSARSQKA